jgi:hypothetical protein
MVNFWSTISGFMSEDVDPSFKEKSFYELKPELPGTKGTYDFVSVLYSLHLGAHCLAVWINGMNKQHLSFGDASLTHAEPTERQGRLDCKHCL